MRHRRPPMRLVFHLTPHRIALLTFLAFYLILICDVRHWSWRDPGSYFFNPEHAFDRVYSLRRETEAENYITASSATGAGNHHVAKAGPSPSLCVGVPTVQRDGTRYFRRALGSVLEGLTVQEREDLFVMPFIVNVDPEQHEAYNEPWLEKLVDQVLTYKDAGDEAVGRVKELMATDVDNKKKALFDYTHLLRTCYEINTAWTLILEDDTVAADGWYQRTSNALRQLEHNSDFDKALYLRLFYNERLLGWNGEEWLSYTIRTVLFIASIFAALTLASRHLPSGRDICTPLTIATITLLICPMLIILFFLAGRLTVAGPSTGLNRMEAYGCCSQAFVFPRPQIPDLLTWYEQHFEKPYIDPVTHTEQTQVDSLTEVWAEEKGLGRWALTPSVFQHVGGKSTKPMNAAQWGRTNVENIWNFGFERLDGDRLRKEHVG
ncbi:uncharacterized protein LTR77_005779 [Saxophila tyrrhenica]|uniref:Integral membrane protein n=1 Tax=Saxophila tyrrhenica TaxID=1690608 RepID=A0AAV9P9F1_9PEZI|nr:hypothetical protein LTR77_005779 [Saxophila tyrrhenica]